MMVWMGDEWWWVWLKMMKIMMIACVGEWQTWDKHSQNRWNERKWWCFIIVERWLKWWVGEGVNECHTCMSDQRKNNVVAQKSWWYMHAKMAQTQRTARCGECCVWCMMVTGVCVVDDGVNERWMMIQMNEKIIYSPKLENEYLSILKIQMKEAYFQF